MPPPPRRSRWSRCEMLNAWAVTCASKSERSRRAVNVPTVTATTPRMTNTTIATLAANRERIGSRDSCFRIRSLSPENVAGSAQPLALKALDEGVSGAGSQTGDASLERIAGGQHQDRDAVVATQLPGDLDSVDLRQPEVEDHHIGQERRGLVERGATVTREPHFVALQTQRSLQHVGDFAVVLDHEHAWVEVQ